MLLAYQAALCVVAVMLAVRLSRRCSGRRRPRRRTRRDPLRDSSRRPRRALGDPTLEIGYWSPAGAYTEMWS